MLIFIEQIYIATLYRTALEPIDGMFLKDFDISSIVVKSPVKSPVFLNFGLACLGTYRATYGDSDVTLICTGLYTT